MSFPAGGGTASAKSRARAPKVIACGDEAARAEEEEAHLGRN